jgi:hypothetical protein
MIQQRPDRIIGSDQRGDESEDEPGKTPLL